VRVKITHIKEFKKICRFKGLGNCTLADSKNVQVLYVWKSLSTATDHFRKKIEKKFKFHNFYFFFDLAVPLLLSRFWSRSAPGLKPTLHYYLHWYAAFNECRVRLDKLIVLWVTIPIEIEYFRVIQKISLFYVHFEKYERLNKKKTWLSFVKKRK
jgi:hypothetical protein